MNGFSGYQKKTYFVINFIFALGIGDLLGIISIWRCCICLHAQVYTTGTIDLQNIYGDCCKDLCVETPHIVYYLLKGTFHHDNAAQFHSIIL